MRVDKKRIIDLMCERDMNQEQLAKCCGIQPATVTSILRGKRTPSVKTINKIALGLGCQPSELLEV